MTGGAHVSDETAKQWLGEALGLHDGDTPFPWQLRLLGRFATGTLDRALDIPTGLGKTAVMAIWLMARATGAKLPRRLVYVVDRRAVVDQATDVAQGLRDYVDRNQALRHALGLGTRSLPISTLRGQHVDNREWLEDPSSPAIIVGTVDMIGSRLLFEGYGISRKMRSYHAGLLGADALLVLDEAHLVPPFEKLLESIADGAEMFGPRDPEVRGVVPGVALLGLSATGRSNGARAFGLTDADLEPGTITRKRLDAEKRLTILPPLGEGGKLPTALADEAWRLTEQGTLTVRCIVFCNRRKDASDVKAAIENLARGDKTLGRKPVAIDIQLLVGGRRVFEREGVAAWLKDKGFLAGHKVTRERAAFLVATSAGEVGVDLDADHMASDLVPWERMVQRLGRVNRRGDTAARIVVVTEAPSKDEKKARELNPDARKSKDEAAIADADRKEATRQLLELVPPRDGSPNVSPGGLREVKLRGADDERLRALLDAATTPAPLRPALSRPLVDAWAMTSLVEHAGRPQIGPWLRGWVDEDPPHTSVVWRRQLPARRAGAGSTDREIEQFFEAAPPHASEVLELETYQVAEWLTARATAVDARAKAKGSKQTDPAHESETLKGWSRSDMAAVVLTNAGELRKSLRLFELIEAEQPKQAKRQAEELNRQLAGATLVVDARLGGLSNGLLDAGAAELPRCADDDEPWMAAAVREAGSPADEKPVTGFRIRRAQAGHEPEPDKNWRQRFRFALELSDDGDVATWLVVEKWQYEGATEEDRSASRPQLLEAHVAATERHARALEERLALGEQYGRALSVAALLHDAGKSAKRWQAAFRARSDGVYAKTLGPVNTALLDGYRHEFGSLATAADDHGLQQLPEDLRDLVLHLIASHHGFARPVVGVGGCDDAPPSALEGRAREVAMRFARLQKRWGPWGLAWWEALLRAADQQASRDNDRGDAEGAKERT